jgi:integrase
MKRRANSEGTIKQRSDGRWEIQLSGEDGARKSIYGRTQREALDRKDAYVKALAGGVPGISDRQSLAAYLEEWLAAKAGKVRPRVHVRYAELLRVHVVPTLGRLQLAKVGPQHLERLYSERISAGSSTGTVRNVHAVIRNALGQAEKWGQVVRNVAKLVSPPAVNRPEMVTLDEKQLQRFLAAAAGERFEGLFVVAVTTGMRQGELLGLRWQDLNLDRSQLSVTRSLSWTKKQGPVFVPPKTKKSRRQIELTKVAIAALRRHRTRQIEQRLAVGDAWETTLDLVFPNEVGRPMDGSNLSERDLRRVLARGELPRIRFHDLRHTAATTLLGRGVHPKFVSEMLGHADVRITLDLYSHVTPTMHREAAAVFDQVLEGVR